MCCSTLKIWKILFILGFVFSSIGEKTYFLALGMIPIKGVCFTARKVTEWLAKILTFYHS